MGRSTYCKFSLNTYTRTYHNPLRVRVIEEATGINPRVLSDVKFWRKEWSSSIASRKVVNRKQFTYTQSRIFFKQLL